MIEHSESTMHVNAGTNHERSLRAITMEVLHELKDFVDTRMQVAKAEFQETIRSMKAGVPLILSALAFAGTGFLMLTVAAVAIVTVVFAGSAYQWFFAFLIVGVLWVALGAILAFFAYNQFHGQGRFPKRTLKVLKDDKIWLENEVRSH